MTQIDEKAFEVALHVLELKHASIKDETRAVITAYLAALPPPAGEVGKMVKRLHDASDVPTKFCDTYHVHQYRLGLLAADMLTTLSAKLAEAEAQSKRNFVAYEFAGALADGATARAERMAAEMERIADLTERWTDSLVSQVNEIARAALSNGGK